MGSRPNILLLVMDSVRASNLSCYGYERPTTPNLDELARAGTLYEQAISVGSWTLPVHASLFTGLFPLNHGVTVSKDALPDGAPTLARRLGELGYETACFSNNPYITAATGLTQGFDTVEDVWTLSHPRGTAKPKGAARLKRLKQRGGAARLLLPPARLLARTRSAARRWKAWRSVEDSGARLTNERLESWLAGRRRADAPFFVFVNYMECHERYSPPHPYGRRFLPANVSLRRAALSSTSKTEILAAPAGRRAEGLAIVRALYDGTLAYLDDQIGALVRVLEATGALDDTVVIVTSDHGDSLGEHDHLGHRLTLYEQLVHVPLVVRYPAAFAAGARVSRQVQLGDLYPTMLELAGDPSDEMTANGFRSLLAPPGGDRREYAVAENTAPKSLNDVQLRMLRGERYKLIWKSSGAHELYDLEEDPGETTDLASARPELVQTMTAELEAWQRSLAGKTIEKGEAEYDDIVLERLRDLGYE